VIINDLNTLKTR